MKLIRNLDDLSTSHQHGAVTVGNFDGVHLGHARIIEQLVTRARLVDGPATVFTFDPHPASLLQPNAVPAALTWLDRKATLLGELGVDFVIAYPTNRCILSLSPDEFFDAIVRKQLAAQVMVEGANFFFGHNRSGSVDLLGKLCTQANISLEVVKPLLVDEQIVSSSRIRNLVRTGCVRDADRLLTSPYRIRGQVVRGAGRGATIGFPTANIEPMGMVLPPLGTYAGRAVVADTSYAAAINIGPNPTFGEQRLKFEVFIIGFDSQIYDEMLEIEFLDRLRDIRPFDSVDALKRQLAADAQTASLLAAGK